MAGSRRPGTASRALHARNRAWQVAALFSLLLVVGCRIELFFNSGFQPQVINQTDNFQLLATGLRNLSRTVQFAWVNTGTSATVTQSSTITGGSATLRIQDASGAQVYSNDLSATGIFVTRAGTSGTWTIELVLSNVSGTLSFRVQRKS